MQHRILMNDSILQPSVEGRPSNHHRSDHPRPSEHRISSRPAETEDPCRPRPHLFHRPTETVCRSRRPTPQARSYCRHHWITRSRAMISEGRSAPVTERSSMKRCFPSRPFHLNLQSLSSRKKCRNRYINIKEFAKFFSTNVMQNLAIKLRIKLLQNPSFFNLGNKTAPKINSRSSFQRFQS